MAPATTVAVAAEEEAMGAQNCQETLVTAAPLHRETKLAARALTIANRIQFLPVG